jgi:GAF domain-containing protein
LHRLALLDTPPEEAFDRLTRLAVKVVEAPVALVTLVDADRQFFKSQVGLDEPWATRRGTPLSYSFCRHVVASGAPLVVEDARRHPLVADNPAVAEMGVVAYVGVPLTLAEGSTLGTLCAIDRAPRHWTVAQIGLLRDLAAAGMTEIELRRLLHEHRALLAATPP